VGNRAIRRGDPPGGGESAAVAGWLNLLPREPAEAATPPSGVLARSIGARRAVSAGGGGAGGPFSRRPAPGRSPPCSRGAGGPRDVSRAQRGAAREHERVGADRRRGGARMARSASRGKVAAMRVTPRRRGGAPKCPECKEAAAPGRTAASRSRGARWMHHGLQIVWVAVFWQLPQSSVPKNSPFTHSYRLFLFASDAPSSQPQ